MSALPSIHNHRRSLLTLSTAFARAAGRLGEHEERCAPAIERELVASDLSIDGATILEALIALAALQASKLDATPRQIFNQMFIDAPSDEWWREKMRPLRQRAIAELGLRVLATDEAANDVCYYLDCDQEPSISIVTPNGLLTYCDEHADIRIRELLA